MNVKKSAGAASSRRERAKATEARITKKAFELFCERGYAGTTMGEIAAAAGVAVQTVYFAFHTKATLLSRAYDYAVMGERESLVPTSQPWYQEMRTANSLTDAVQHMVVGVGEITRRLTPLYIIAQSTAASDPEVAEVVNRHERWRIEGYAQVLEVLRTKAPLRSGLDPERANHLLLLYVGMDVYHFLVEVSGWSHDEWAAWTTETLAAQLFE